MSRYADLLGATALAINSDPVRPGQALMNALWDIDRDVYNEVIDAGMDPFYIEGPIPNNVLAFIAERMD